MTERWKKFGVDGLLILVTIIWGSTFLVTQNALREISPFCFLAIRFGVAALALMLIFHRRLWRITRSELWLGSFIGVFLFATYGLQTLGLQLIPTSKTGFITGLYVVIVPVLAIIFLNQVPTAGAIIGVALATVGLGLMSINNNFNFAFGEGEMLVVGCAFACALHIVAISKFAPGRDAVNLSIVQITVTALLSLIAMPLNGESLQMPSLPAWGSIFFLALVATAFTLVVMNRVQQFTTSTRAALIYALEPVFAGLFGYLAGEVLSSPAWLGCGLIFAGMVMAEVKIIPFWRTLTGTKPLTS